MSKDDQAVVLPYLDRAGRPTLRTVAFVANVHPSTVSRALSANEAELARAGSEETIAQIRRIAEDLGYSRNPWAAGLRSQTNRAVGALVPRLTDIVLATIYEGIEDGARENGLLALVANTRDYEQTRIEAAELMVSRRVDGLIIGDARVRDDRLLRSLGSRNVPFVLVSRSSEEYPSVTCDDELGGRLAAAHLLDLGHEDVVVVAGESYASTGIDRSRGFVEHFANAGVDVTPADLYRSGFDVDAGYETMSRILLERTKAPTAVFAVNDFAAIGVLGALRDAGLIAGTDVAVIGYNDIPIAKQLPIGLTSVRSPLGQMGQQAIAALIQTMEGKTVENLRLPPTLSVRASTVPDVENRRV